MTLNLDDGGEQRFASIRTLVLEQQPHVLGLVEANGWAEGALPDPVDASHRPLMGAASKASVLGFTYSHVMAAGGGYDLALLSWAPITVVAEMRQGFERGVLHAVTDGTHVLLAHLNAHDSARRAEEAALVAAVVANLTARGEPVVVMGDMNSLSPLDAACHEAEDVARFAAGESLLRNKLLSADGSLSYATMRVLLGGEVGEAALIDGAWQSARTEACSERALCDRVITADRSGVAEAHALAHAPKPAVTRFEGSDAQPLPPLEDWQNCPFGNDTAGVPAASLCTYCSRLATSPTSIHPDQVRLEDKEPPMRLDYILMNSVLYGSLGSLDCRSLQHGLARDASDHFAVVCRWQ